MGWTGYYGLTADEAKHAEVNGCDVIAKSGNWWLVVPQDEERRHKYPAILVKFITERSDGQVAVKTLDITMGVGVPPATIARKYLAYYNGDFDAAGGTYGADDLREAVKPKKTVTLKAGDMFTISGSPYTFSGGGSLDGDYRFVGKYIAGRLDNSNRCRMPKDFKKYITNVVPA